MSLSTTTKISIAEEASRLAEPFTMVDLAQIDDLALSVFLCEGTMPFHRHLDQDELFLPYNGTIRIDSDWGGLTLRPGDATVVPKGVGHRSSSLLRSLVLLVQARLMISRRNGHRRLSALKEEDGLPKISVPVAGREMVADFEPRPLLDVDTFALTLAVCQGQGPWQQADDGSSLVLCYQGQIDLESEFGDLSLHNGELVVVPRGTPYRLSSATRSLVLGVQRHPHPDPVPPDQP
ncbi:MAG: homogentisate 1,2-dioxygenase [Anaerolineae bacterium]